MLNDVILIFPVYLTLFWTVVLGSNTRNHGIPRQFLSIFMLFAFIIYLSHFFFFSKREAIYVYFEPLYQLSSLLVFPLYNIYVRLLTIDDCFSFKKHLLYLLPSFILFVLYVIAIYITPLEEYKRWLFGNESVISSANLLFLSSLQKLIRITFLVQVVLTVYSNLRLISKFSVQAAFYYSNIEEIGLTKVKLINFSMLLMGVFSFVAGFMGRHFFLEHPGLLFVLVMAFSSLLYIIGWLGNEQVYIHSLENDNLCTEETVVESELSTSGQSVVYDKLVLLFEIEKVFLNSKLNIQDVAQMIGTNRSYVSLVINGRFNQNFCAFVNGYRILELERYFLNSPNLSNQLLAESCGFGSVDSLKRAIFSNFGISLAEWKKSRVVKHK